MTALCTVLAAACTKEHAASESSSERQRQRIENGTVLREDDGISFESDLTSAAITRDGELAFVDRRAVVSDRQQVIGGEAEHGSGLHRSRDTRAPVAARREAREDEGATLRSLGQISV